MKVETLFEPVGGLSSLQESGIIDSRMSNQFELPVDPQKVRQKPGLITRYYGQPRN
jgi:hypothetical protein